MYSDASSVPTSRKSFKCGVTFVSLFCKRLSERDASRIDSVSWQGTMAQWLFCVFAGVTLVQQFCSAARSPSQMGPPIAHARLLGFWIPPLFWEDVNRWRQVNYDFLFSSHRLEERLCEPVRCFLVCVILQVLQNCASFASVFRWCALL